MPISKEEKLRLAVQKLVSGPVTAESLFVYSASLYGVMQFGSGLTFGQVAEILKQEIPKEQSLDE